MKTGSISILVLSVALGLLGLVVTGCAHTLCVKTVDATTGRPLAGVSTSWQQSYHGIVHFGHEGPTDLPPSGEDGLINVGELHRNWSGSFIFACPGYANVYGEFTSKGKLILAEKIEYFPPGKLEGQFYLKGDMTSAPQSNGCFLVKMSK